MDQEVLPEKTRTLCDRCGTQIVGLMGHCSSCEWDVCSDCVTALRQQLQRTHPGLTHGSSDSKDSSSSSKDSSQTTDGSEQQPQRQHLKVNCSNPACPSVLAQAAPSGSGSSDKRSGEGCMTQRWRQDVVRGQLFSQAGAAELHLHVLLPADLLPHLEHLQQLGQVRLLMPHHLQTVGLRSALMYLVSTTPHTRVHAPTQHKTAYTQQLLADTVHYEYPFMKRTA